MLILSDRSSLSCSIDMNVHIFLSTTEKKSILSYTNSCRYFIRMPRSVCLTLCIYTDGLLSLSYVTFSNYIISTHLTLSARLGTNYVRWRFFTRGMILFFVWRRLALPDLHEYCRYMYVRVSGSNTNENNKKQTLSTVERQTDH